MDKIYTTDREIILKNTNHLKTASKAFKEFEKAKKALGDYHVGYIGKHFAIAPNEDNPSELSEADFQPHLLVECRLFNEETEYFFTPRNGEVLLRTVKSSPATEKSDSARDFITKEVQLRSGGTLQINHYIREDGNGYDFYVFNTLNFSG